MSTAHPPPPSACDGQHALDRSDEAGWGVRPHLEPSRLPADATPEEGSSPDLPAHLGERTPAFTGGQVVRPAVLRVKTRDRHRPWRGRPDARHYSRETRLAWRVFCRRWLGRAGRPSLPLC